MSQWRVWCVDGDDERLSAEESDLFISWQWVDRWTLEAVIPQDEKMLIIKKGTLTHFHVEHADKAGIFFLASLPWDQRVYADYSVVSTTLTIKIDAGLIVLFEEYLPLRPPA